MGLTNQEIEELRQLEESLWVAETRFNREYIESVLAPDFFEFGRSGRSYTRERILTFPPADQQVIDANLPLKDFEAHSIEEGVVLVTYISERMVDRLEISNRSSLWVRTSAGWQLRFHQGTPVEG